MDYFCPYHYLDKGFLPVTRELDPLQVKETSKVRENRSEEIPDSLKILYFRRLVNELDNTKLVFVVSPTWYGIKESSLDEIKELAIENKIEFWDFSCDTSFVHHNDLFYDGVHLNAKGADKFTKELIRKLKSVLN